MRNRRRLTGWLMLGLLVGFPAAPALAQLENIVVTARKVEETLQEAPISVTAFGERTIETAGLRNVADLARLTPNLTFEAGETGAPGFEFRRVLLRRPAIAAERGDRVAALRADQIQVGIVFPTESHGDGVVDRFAMQADRGALKGYLSGVEHFIGTGERESTRRSAVGGLQRLVEGDFGGRDVNRERAARDH